MTVITDENLHDESVHVCCNNNITMYYPRKGLMCAAIHMQSKSVSLPNLYQSQARDWLRNQTRKHQFRPRCKLLVQTSRRVQNYVMGNFNFWALDFVSCTKDICDNHRRSRHLKGGGIINIALRLRKIHFLPNLVKLLVKQAQPKLNASKDTRPWVHRFEK